MSPWLAAILALVLTGFLVQQGPRMRKREEKSDDQFAEAAAPHKLYWRVTHARDDISGIALSIALTNALLAAILATLIK